MVALLLILCLTFPARQGIWIGAKNPPIAIQGNKFVKPTWHRIQFCCKQHTMKTLPKPIWEKKFNDSST